MSASPEELIAINSLLIQREAAFARVHTAESRISELLGGPYPFDAPEVILPSSIKTKPQKAAKLKPKVATKAIKPRRLNANEVAYQFSWIDKGQAVTHKVTDLKSLSVLLDESLPSFKLVRIETIDLNGALVDTLLP